MVSVAATPVAVPPSIAEEHAPLLIVLVPRETVPLATVTVSVELDGMVVPLTEVVEESAVAIFPAGRTPVTALDPPARFSAP